MRSLEWLRGQDDTFIFHDQIGKLHLRASSKRRFSDNVYKGAHANWRRKGNFKIKDSYSMAFRRHGFSWSYPKLPPMLSYWLFGRFFPMKKSIQLYPHVIQSYQGDPQYICKNLSPSIWHSSWKGTRSYNIYYFLRNQSHYMNIYMWN